MHGGVHASMEVWVFSADISSKASQSSLQPIHGTCKAHATHPHTPGCVVRLLFQKPSVKMPRATLNHSFRSSGTTSTCRQPRSRRLVAKES